LARNPPPTAEAPLLERWAIVGLRPGTIEVWSQLADTVRAAWAARIAPAHLALHRAATKTRRDVQGWRTSGPGIGAMYEQMPDGKMFFAGNPLQRYSIGDRTPGLTRNADGTLDIWLQHETPGNNALCSNWLPAPAGPFVIVLRAYLPRRELREGRAELPIVMCIDHA
jgi:hypothetical protein